MTPITLLLLLWPTFADATPPAAPSADSSTHDAAGATEGAVEEVAAAVPAVEPAPPEPVPAVEPAPPEPAPAVEPAPPEPAAVDPAPPEPAAVDPVPAPLHQVYTPATAAEWFTPLVIAPPAAPAAADEPAVINLLPSPADLVARGPEVLARRLAWLVLAALAVLLTGRLARRRRPGPTRRLLDRIRAAWRTIAALAGAGLVLALLPAQWLPWVVLVAGSAAIAVGWSLRPYAADALAGVVLGIWGRLSTGGRLATTDLQGEVLHSGPFNTTVRTDDGAVHTVPNRQLVGGVPSRRPPERHTTVVQVPLPPNTAEIVGLRAIRAAIAMVPWTASDVDPVIQLQSPGQWSVRVSLLGRHPPADTVAAILPTLVAEVLESES